MNYHSSRRCCIIDEMSQGGTKAAAPLALPLNASLRWALLMVSLSYSDNVLIVVYFFCCSCAAFGRNKYIHDDDYYYAWLNNTDFCSTSCMQCIKRCVKIFSVCLSVCLNDEHATSPSTLFCVLTCTCNACIVGIHRETFDGRRQITVKWGQCDFRPLSDRVSKTVGDTTMVIINH